MTRQLPPKIDRPAQSYTAIASPLYPPVIVAATTAAPSCTGNVDTSYDCYYSDSMRMTWNEEQRRSRNYYSPSASLSFCFPLLLKCTSWSDHVETMPLGHFTFNCNNVASFTGTAQQRLRNCRASVRLSVCLSVPSSDRSRGVRRFAAERRVHRMYRSIAAAAGRPAAASPQHGAQQQLRAESRVTDDVVN